MCSTCNLSFWLHIDTAETSTTTAYDKLTVQVLNSSGSTTGLTASPQGRGLRNLGSNAIRHAPGDGIIDVLAEVLRPPGHPGRRLGRPVPGHHRPLTTAAEFAGTASDRSSWQDARNLRAA